MTLLVAMIISGIAAFILDRAAKAGEHAEAERQGKIVVSLDFFNAAESSRFAYERAGDSPDQLWRRTTTVKPSERFERYGGGQAEIEQKLRDELRQHQGQNLVTAQQVARGLTALPRAGALTGFFGSMALLWWFAMLVFQGEGLELDLQRRRHPMWEWLFSHPVPPGAVFLAEMFSPLAANPMYWVAPLFAGISYGLVYGLELGIWAAFLIGIPLAVAASCLGKALEIAVILRTGPRTRGALIGLMGWFGYASMVFFFFGLTIIPKVASALGNALKFSLGCPGPG